MIELIVFGIADWYLASCAFGQVLLVSDEDYSLCSAGQGGLLFDWWAVICLEYLVQCSLKHMCQEVMVHYIFICYWPKSLYFSDQRYCYSSFQSHILQENKSHIIWNTGTYITQHRKEQTLCNLSSKAQHILSVFHTSKRTFSI